MKDYVYFKIVLVLLFLIPKTFATTAPIIKATGDITYCPGSYTKIVSSVELIDPDNVVTEIYIQISTGYINGQDQLTLAGTHPNIGFYPFDSTTGKLRLYGLGVTATTADFEAAIKDVAFYNSSASPTGTREFSITIGQANYLPRNKHFYEYVSSPGIRWDNAKTAAALKTYYGLQGYLATLTSADEAQLSGAQASGAGWIGGTDEAQEGTWKWVTGPEGLANGGTGTVFWIGTGGGYSPSPINFAFWNTNNGEPNNAGNENYAHITDPALPGASKGSWNDLAVTGGSGYYFPQGYIVEYGGMVAGDVDNIQISASTTLTMAKITTTTPSPVICSTATTTLQANSTTGTILWYDLPDGGSSLGTENTFTTPQLNTTTTFYIDNGCPTRTPITVTVNPLPIAVAASNISYCQNETAIALAGAASANCTLNWYNDATGGTASFTRPIPITTSVGITSYFVSQTLTATGCEGPRSEIKVNVNPLPIAPLVSDIIYCQNETALPLTATKSALCVLNWYLIPIGGTSSSTNPTPSTTTVGTTTYYVSQTIIASGCEGSRSAILVKINPLQTAPLVSDIPYCLNETASQLTATASANCTLNWYTSTTGGIPSSTAPTPLTTAVGITPYFVSQTITATGCEGSRSEIKVTVNPLPVVNDVTIVQCDSDSNPDGKTYFNLTVNNNLISTNYYNENFTYYTSSSGANNEILTDKIPNELAFENTTPYTMDVWTRVADKITGCYSVAKITLKVSVTQIDATYHRDFKNCDDALSSDTDGFSVFDFHEVTSDIETMLPLPSSNYSIKYYPTQTEALEEINEIPNPSSFRNTVINKQDIWVRVDSNLDNACFGIGLYVTLIVNPLPNINLNTNGAEDELVCSNLSAFFVTLDAGIQDGSPTGNYNYIWSKDGIVLSNTNPTLGVNFEGLYTVDVANKSFGCSRTRTITVIASNSATIDTIEIVDLIDINSVTVKVTGPGNYQYSLDEPSGFWQDSNFFTNVSAGIHEVYINDKNGCGVVSKTIAVIGAPKLFTPNNDGYNDSWSVKGVNQTFNSKSILYIFDRFGKLLKQWVPSSNQGWDGTFNGTPLPADDYWFTLKLEDGREAKGHFSLKR